MFGGGRWWWESGTVTLSWVLRSWVGGGGGRIKAARCTLMIVFAEEILDSALYNFHHFRKMNDNLGLSCLLVLHC